MIEPTQTCLTCGAVEIVHPDGRGFPPDIAKRRLAKRCRAAGHRSRPVYRAGVLVQATTTVPTDTGAQPCGGSA